MGERLTGQGLSREHVTSQHLTYRLNVILKPSDAILRTEEEQEHRHEDR